MSQHTLKCGILGVLSMILWKIRTFQQNLDHFEQKSPDADQSPEIWTKVGALPVAILGPHCGHIGFYRWCSVAGSERVPLAPLGWYFMSELVS